jgi:NAD/NADP transhydrogenase alpha subunit
VEVLREAGVTAFGLDAVPRTISRAQAFDTLSSMVGRTSLSPLPSLTPD